MEGLIIIILIVVIIVFSGMRTESHKTKIETQVLYLGGTLIGYERRNIFTGLGPFTVVGKGRVVYKIDYEVNGERKEGWVRFGGITGPDWRF
ncbi:hypothetical protein [Oceanirhabdus sp. W0125-5]|uniref:hypothetical protein n=1 Tax=Oceanirhabdus sp. W0125-5 TaxID=2999116 RepID=UPI0022F2BAB5|nr:hypothetical protein [Oceanirhabdus sp. W0125-5]WBW95605.1 hypothetical protein OW730_18170 [Oceanirhabdus sp. W0125-5]